MTSVLTTILGLLIDAVALGDATSSISQELKSNPENAYNQALAALEAETPEISAEILLGLAWIESRYDSRAVSRVEGEARKTGVPSWKSPPYGTRSFFCGVTQASAETWGKCKELHNSYIAYRKAVEELDKWLATKVCKGNLDCALTGYNGGFPAIKAGSRSYARVVRRKADLIRKRRN